MINVQAILQERESTYGAFPVQANISQLMKEIAHGTAGWARLHQDQREALDMIIHKVARALNGDPKYADNWVDIAGYAQLVANRLTKEAKDTKIYPGGGPVLQVEQELTDLRAYKPLPYSRDKKPESACDNVPKSKEATQDERHMALALAVAASSKDPRTKVGCVVVSEGGIHLSTGYNGFARGVKDDPVLWDSEGKHDYVIHAEINALLHADHSRLRGATVYVTKAPCTHCASVLCQLHALYGPLTVVTFKLAPKSKYLASHEKAVRQFNDVGLKVRYLGGENA